MFYDDELNVSKSFVDLMNGLSDLQARLGADFRLRGFVKSELFTKEQAEAMYRAGFRWLLMRFRGGARAHPRQHRQAGEACRQRLAASRLPGGRPEGQGADVVSAIRASRIETIAEHPRLAARGAARRFRLHDHHHLSRHAVLRRWRCRIRACLDVWTYTHPKTGDRLHACEVDFTVCADYYKGDPNGGYRSFVFTDHMSAEELVKLRDMVERDVREALNIPFNPGAPALATSIQWGRDCRISFTGSA